jgi:hypothetical protein
MFARVRSSRGAGVLGELLMLVVGINIALWFEGKFEDIQDADTEQQYLRGLRDDLTVDLDRLERLIKFNQKKLDKLSQILPQLPGLAEAPPEELGDAMFAPSGYDFFQPSDFTYRSMQESGDFRLLSDDDLKKALLKLARRYREIDLLQQNFIQALDDGYIPLIMQNFDILQMRLTDPAMLDSLMFRNFFAYAIQDTGQRMELFENARDQARELIERIEAQIH